MENRFERFSISIAEIYKCWHKLTAEEMEKQGLKGAHSIYLITMYRYPNGLTAPQICDICGKDKADVSRMMSIMEKGGLVTKEGRHQNLYGGVFKLTDKGISAAEFVRKRASLAVEIAGKDLSEEQRIFFYESLETIANNLKDLSKNGIPD